MSNEFKNTDFLDDEEKMRDFICLTKEEFLASYSYLTEDEYDNTYKRYYAQNLKIIENVKSLHRRRYENDKARAER